MKLRINEKEFPLLSARAAMEMLKGYRRDVITLVVESSFAAMDDVFVDGATFSIVETTTQEGEPIEQVNEYTDHTVAGPITDNRDGTISVKMGKTNTKEQDLETQVAEANATLNTIVGSEVTDVQMVRAVVEAGAATLTDGEAAKMPSLSQKWVVGEAVNVGDRRYYAPRLYKVIQAHTTQADWTPDVTPALWAVVGDPGQAGTIDDPITAARGMEYEYGLYYFDPEDGKIYLCEREGEEPGNTIILQYLPHELVGQYFSAAETGTEEPETPEEAAGQETAAEEGGIV